MQSSSAARRTVFESVYRTSRGARRLKSRTALETQLLSNVRIGPLPTPPPPPPLLPPPWVRKGSRAVADAAVHFVASWEEAILLATGLSWCLSLLLVVPAAGEDAADGVGAWPYRRPNEGSGDKSQACGKLHFSWEKMRSALVDWLKSRCVACNGPWRSWRTNVVFKTTTE